MRTDDPNPPAAGLDRLRGQVARARRWISGREAGPRRILALGALAVLTALAYLAMPADRADLEWIYGGQRFSPGDVATIKAVLAERRIAPVKLDEQGRVAIPLDRMTEAVAALRKRHIDDPTIAEIRDKALEGSILDGPDEHRQRQLQVHERTLKALIEKLAGIVQADVMINPLPVPGFGLRARGARALVQVQSEGDRPIPFKTVKMILQLLTSGTDYQLTPEAVTLLGKDETYLSPDEPARLRQVLVHAHEEDLAEEVLARLAGIDGVRVSARLAAGSPPGAGSEPLPPLPSPDATERAWVSVQVPEGYYRRVFGTIEPGRTPTPEDLEAYREQIDAKIRALVAQAVPAAELGGVTIEPIANPVPSPRAPAVAPTPAPASRPRPWWVPVAAAGVVVVLALATIRRLGTRRPSARSPGPPRAPHPHFGPAAGATEPAGGHGPSPLERVRELVRLDPEAAAGVLQRWVGQGGHSS
jgi:flagellar biosynthesis/type III secretory pathway M-ring protein FliF/YscJ